MSKKFTNVDFIAIYLFRNGPSRRVDIETALSKKTKLGRKSDTEYLSPNEGCHYNKYCAPKGHIGFWEKDYDHSRVVSTVIRTPEYVHCLKTTTHAVYKLTAAGIDRAIKAETSFGDEFDTILST